MIHARSTARCLGARLNLCMYNFFLCVLFMRVCVCVLREHPDSQGVLVVETEWCLAHELLAVVPGIAQVLGLKVTHPIVGWLYGPSTNRRFP